MQARRGLTSTGVTEAASGGSERWAQQSRGHVWGSRAHAEAQKVLHENVHSGGRAGGGEIEVTQEMKRRACR